ncbi:uncharacterized protein LOC143071656 isoform X3 [Mytilus galloprovincialis]|uniref:uncharacterized protein LOC143071656 isoform X3 n=1 Tax=Mytilus galloprovincialis TaxID=29158 RepID=UPI003F7B5C4C
MALTISDMLHTVQRSIQYLQQTQSQVTHKINHASPTVTNEISRLEGIENRLMKVYETKKRNSAQLQLILESVGVLTKKLQTVSTSIDENRTKESSKTLRQIKCDQLSMQIETDGSDIPTIDNSTEQLVDEYEYKERQEHHPNLKDSAYCHGKPRVSVQQPPNRSETASSSKNSSTDTLKAKVTVVKSKTAEQIVDKKIKKRKSKYGFRLCRTNDNLDNRTFFRKKKRCYQGELLLPKIDNQVEEEPKPNITPAGMDGRSYRDTGRENGHKKRGIMTMAQMTERDYDNKQNVHSLIEWAHIATQSQMEVAMKLMLNVEKLSTHGHDYMLLLDTSESMQGEKFNLMIKTATNYIEGLHRASLRYNFRDNVGLTCFGAETKLVLPPLADYDDIKREIGKLKAGGPSPLTAGLLMALSGLSHCGTTQIVNHDFKPYIILITDGMPTRVEAPNEEDRGGGSALAVSSLLTNLDREKELQKVVKDIAGRGIRIFCVPIGSANTDIMRRIVTKTHGKMIPAEQIHRICKNTQTLFHASEIAHQLGTATEIDKSSVKTVVRSADLQDFDDFDDVTDNVMLLLNPMTQYSGYFKQSKCPAVQLGQRVRRGPNWQWKNQDSNMAGTVIGEDDDGMIWVEWDSGHKNCYQYDENFKVFHIKPVNEPRRLVDEMIAVGCKIGRGKNWKHGDQDGGRGSRGTVLRVESDGKVVVYWERGRLGIYKFGSENLFEVEVCEHGRSLGLPDSDLIEDEENTRQDMMPELPLILPSHLNKMKPVMSVWQYQNSDGQWVSYDEETNVKIERAYNRKPNGKCIIDLDKTVHVVLFSKMVQENQMDKSIVPVQRLDRERDIQEEKQ